ncbi:sulfatase [Salinigranum rubrum]|uniref:Sulfatase n=1 Tax=Salinigranum rubrum TaxID=755307 RepID=A0A2I8VLP6_9EURY|nr:sulfatase-like hydrolase/transferase [Salinigranum rubrum]AUV82846.1 sulfatase [Salinigranum rubrum]
MKRNVVLICLDTVRKDYFDRFAPRLSAAANVSYEQCRTASAWSTPSHASMLTGTLPHEHGVHTHNRDFSTLAREDTVIGDLTREGYAALGVSANLFVGPRYGFDTLFDRFTPVTPDVVFQDAWEPLDVEGTGVRRGLNYVRAARDRNQLGKYTANVAAHRVNQILKRLPVSFQDKGGAAVSREALGQIRETEGPFVQFVNFMDAHQPHHPFRGIDDSLHAVPRGWTSADDFYRVKWDINREGRVEENREFLDRFEQLYGASVEYLDRLVVDFIDQVRAETDGNTTFVVTADHGENLGGAADGYLFEHTSSLSEGLLHVPCVVVDAPTDDERVVTETVSHLQLRELLVGLARGELPDISRDRIAAEVVGLSPGTVDLTADEEAYFDRMLRAVYEGDRKYVWDSQGNALAYRLDCERPSWQELTEEDVRPPEWASAFFPGDITTAKERARDGASEGRETVDSFAEARLRDLGYL